MCSPETIQFTTAFPDLEDFKTFAYTTIIILGPLRSDIKQFVFDALAYEPKNVNLVIVSDDADIEHYFRIASRMLITIAETPTCAVIIVVPDNCDIEPTKELFNYKAILPVMTISEFDDPIMNPCSRVFGDNLSSFIQIYRNESRNDQMCPLCGNVYSNCISTFGSPCWLQFICSYVVM